MKLKNFLATLAVSFAAASCHPVAAQMVDYSIGYRTPHAVFQLIGTTYPYYPQRPVTVVVPSYPVYVQPWQPAYQSPVTPVYVYPDRQVYVPAVRCYPFYDNIRQKWSNCP